MLRSSSIRSKTSYPTIEEKPPVAMPAALLCRLAIFGEGGELAQDFSGAGKTLLGGLPLLEENHFHVGTHARRLTVLADEKHQPVRLSEFVLTERDYRALLPGIHLLDIGPSAIVLDRRYLEEITDLVRQHAETVAQFGGEIIDLLVG